MSDNSGSNSNDDKKSSESTTTNHDTGSNSNNNNNETEMSGGRPETADERDKINDIIQMLRKQKCQCNFY